LKLTKGDEAGEAGMGRLRLALIGVLIAVDLAILLGTPFLETVGAVPRRLGHTFAHFSSDPAAAALPLVRLLLGAVVLAAILDQIRIFVRRPTVLPPPPEAPGWTDLQVRQRSESQQPASMAVRDRWHDLPAWTWEGIEGGRNVQVGDTVWQVERFTVTVETGIDFDEALRRIEVHDAFRQLANDAQDFDHRRAVVVALTAGLHWPFLGRSTFALATTRITAAVVSALDGVFVLRSQETRNGGPGSSASAGGWGDSSGPAGYPGTGGAPGSGSGSAGSASAGDIAYLVAPTTAATALVEHDPDLVVALVDHLAPPAAPPTPTSSAAQPAAGPAPAPGATAGTRSGDDLHRRLTAAVARTDPALGPRSGLPLSPPSQEAVFRIQQADPFQSERANTRDHRHIVSVAKIDRIYLSTQTPTGIPIGTFRQVTAQATPLERPVLEAGPGPESPSRPDRPTP
jgi:hypothetical protein